MPLIIPPRVADASAPPPQKETYAQIATRLHMARSVLLSKMAEVDMILAALDENTPVHSYWLDQKNSHVSTLKIVEGK